MGWFSTQVWPFQLETWWASRRFLTELPWTEVIFDSGIPCTDWGWNREISMLPIPTGFDTQGRKGWEMQSYPALIHFGHGNDTILGQVFMKMVCVVCCVLSCARVCCPLPLSWRVTRHGAVRGLGSRWHRSYWCLTAFQNYCGINNIQSYPRMS